MSREGAAKGRNGDGVTVDGQPPTNKASTKSTKSTKSTVST